MAQQSHFFVSQNKTSATRFINTAEQSHIFAFCLGAKNRSGISRARSLVIGLEPSAEIGRLICTSRDPIKKRLIDNVVKSCLVRRRFLLVFRRLKFTSTSVSVVKIGSLEVATRRLGRVGLATCSGPVPILVA